MDHQRDPAPYPLFRVSAVTIRRGMVAESHPRYFPFSQVRLCDIFHSYAVRKEQLVEL